MIRALRLEKYVYSVQKQLLKWAVVCICVVCDALFAFTRPHARTPGTAMLVQILQTLQVTAARCLHRYQDRPGAALCVCILQTLKMYVPRGALWDFIRLSASTVFQCMLQQG